MNLLQIIKLAKQIEKFVEVETDNGVLIIDGDAEIGKEVYIEGEEGVVPAVDGEYVSEDNIIIIADGKIAEINDKPAEPVEEPKEEPTEEPKEEPVEEPKEEKPEEPVEEPKEEPVEEPKEEPQPDEKDTKIAELENRIKELEAENAELKAQLETANEALSQPVKTETKMAKDAPKSKVINYLNKK